MEAASGRLHNSGGAAFGGPPTVVESIMVWLIRIFLLILGRPKTRRNVKRQSFKRQSRADRIRDRGPTLFEIIFPVSIGVYQMSQDVVQVQLV